MDVSYGGGNLVVVVLLSAIPILILWTIIYTAVKSATSNALDRVRARLVAEAKVTPGGVEFVVTNAGNGPAFDLSVRWVDGPSDIVLAHTVLLGVNGRLEWTLVDQILPGEALAIRQIRLDWGRNIDPSFGRQSSVQALLLPSRVDRSS